MVKIRYLVTSALPYVNYRLHLGHLVGCLLPSDVYSRFLRANDEQCVYICGTDEHGTPIAVAAQKEGITPQELTDKYHALQQQVIDKFGISVDIFSRTTTEEHTKVTQDFYYKLKQNNYIYRKEIEQLYCEKCARFLPDRYVEGKCPLCGAEAARGDQCDACGKPLDPTQLIEPYCTTCRGKPALKKSEHVFFDLAKLQPQLKEWLEGHEGLFPNAKNFAISFVNEGLREKDISRNISWGIPIPDAKDLVFYVWFDAPIGYITFTKQAGKENWWHDNNTRLVHFLGKDNIVFHTVYFPGMLMAAGDYVLPYKIGSYEYLTFGGSKLSKSKGNVIDALKAVEALPADYWRYALISLLPEKKDTDFTWEGFQEIVNNDLNDTIGNFVHRTLTFAQKFYAGKVEKPELSNVDVKLLEKINSVVESSSKAFYDIELKKALQEIVSLAREGNEFISLEEPWKNEKRRQNVVYVSLSLVKALSVLMQPFTPESAEKLRQYLGISETSWKSAGKLEDKFAIAADVKPLFRKIDDKELASLIEKFEKKTEPKKESGKPMITYEDFAKLDMRIGEVKAAEKVEGSDKLLKLTIDIGEETRTVVSGIAQNYKPEEMVGKSIILLANLAPKKLKGIESQGMILAAEKNGVLGLLTTDKKIGNGSAVE